MSCGCVRAGLRVQWTICHWSSRSFILVCPLSRSCGWTSGTASTSQERGWTAATSSFSTWLNELQEEVNENKNFIQERINPQGTRQLWRIHLWRSLFIQPSTPLCMPRLQFKQGLCPPALAMVNSGLHHQVRQDSLGAASFLPYLLFWQ